MQTLLVSFCSEGSVNVCFLVLTTFERRRKKTVVLEGKVEVLETIESDELVSEVCLCCVVGQWSKWREENMDLRRER